MTRLKALLTVGTPAAAGPFGVSMGDPVKLDDGWSPGGFGSKGRESKGALGFDYVVLEGHGKFRREFLGLHFALRRWVILYRSHG